MKLNRSRILDLPILGLLLVLYVTASTGKAQNISAFNVLHTFATSDYASTPIQGPDGNFYGTRAEGGDYRLGSVYRVTPSGVVTTLHSFTGADGSLPYAPLMLANDGNFYGTTLTGGTGGSPGLGGLGTVYRITPSGSFSTLYSFTGGSDQRFPFAGLIQGTDSALYGMTEGDIDVTTPTSTDGGTIFRVTLAGAFSTLHVFNPATEGGEPKDALVLGSDGNFYGRTAYGPSSIFKFSPAGVLTMLPTGVDLSGLVGAGGMLYGYDQWSYPYGAIYSMTYAGYAHALYNLTEAEAGYSVFGKLAVDSAGSLYGVFADSFSPTVFQLSSSGSLSVLHTFDASYRYAFFTGLTIGSDGALYGATSVGSTNGSGEVYRVTSQQSFTTVAPFGDPDGAGPSGPPIEAADGYVYGVTGAGGAAGLGTIYKISPTGATTILHSFRGPDGSGPVGPLVQAADGNFYGVTILGGANGVGAVYSISADGSFAIVYSFNGVTDAGGPQSGLIQGTDGALYGTTPAGRTPSGQTIWGNVYRLTTDGSFSILHTFSGPDGGGSVVSLVLAGDGNFYGVAEGGNGAIFRLTPAGEFATLHTFNGSDGYEPNALTLGLDGRLYGTCLGGGPYSDGSVYSLGLDGAFEVLPGYGTGNNQSPQGNDQSPQGILGASDGFVYVTGNYNDIFRFAPDGSESDFYDFSYGNWYSYNAVGLTQGVDFNLYGSANRSPISESGYNGGIVFQLIPVPPTPKLNAVANGSYVTLMWTPSVRATSYNVYRSTSPGGEGSTPYQTGITATHWVDSNATNGTTYYYEVTAVDIAGESPKSNEVSPITVANTAAFVTSDSTTQGNWKGVYGSDGANVIGDPSSGNGTYPWYATVSTSGASTTTWTASSLGNAALQSFVPGSANRMLGAWTAPSTFTIDINLTDGNAHPVALYLADYGNTGLAESISVEDAATGTVLDTQSAASFAGGVYDVWNITGHVKFVVTSTAGTNCVVSGLYFGNAAGSTASAAPSNVSAVAGVQTAAMTWSASTGASSYNVYRGTSAGNEDPIPIATGLTQTSYVDQGLTQGATYYYKVVAVNAVGGSFASTEASATVLGPSVTFFNSDTTTQGNWKGVYGGDGWDIAGDPSANNPTIPSYATVSITGDSLSVPAPSTTDPRALLKSDPAATDRVAGMWNAATSETFDIALTDGNIHRIALYFLDWDNSARVQSITITDPTTNAVLDRRSVSSFQNGIYDVWDISGHVSVTVTYTGSTGSNAAVSGLFFGQANVNAPGAPSGLTATGSTGLTM